MQMCCERDIPLVFLVNTVQDEGETDSTKGEWVLIEKGANSVQMCWERDIPLVFLVNTAWDEGKTDSRQGELVLTD